MDVQETPAPPYIQNDYNTIRCLEKNCFSIPLINIIKDNNNIMINYKCTNGHKDQNIPIQKFITLGNKNIGNFCCNNCSLNRDKNKDIRLYYCYKCKETICNLEKCNIKHETKCENKNLIELEKFDSTCLIHGKYYIFYCNDCKISFCSSCENHKNHDKSLIDEIGFDNTDKNIIIREINESLNKLDQLYNKIKNINTNITKIYEMNKSLLQLNKIFYENLNNKEINGEIYKNALNCFYLKNIDLKKNFDYFENISLEMEKYFINTFFEFDSEKQRQILKFRKKIPVEISFEEFRNSFSFFSKGNKKIKDNEKKLCPPEITINQLIYLYRNKMKLDKKEAIYMFVNGKTSVTGELTLSEVYDKYKNDDNILKLSIVVGELRW